MWSIDIYLIVLALTFLIYYYLTENFDYWKKHGVVGPRPTIFFGTLKDVILGKVHLADYTKKICDDYPNEPAVGLFFKNIPLLLVKDFDMMKEVLVKKFKNFSNREFKVHLDLDPLQQHLVFLEYDKWKPLRANLTPVFSSSKLKEMFYLIYQCTKHFIVHLETLAAQDIPVECREITAKLTTDVIGVCVFGLDINSMSDDGNEFRKMGRAALADTWSNRVRTAIQLLPHWMAVLLKPLSGIDAELNFFVDTFTSTMKQRHKSGIRRNDMVDLLMDLKKKHDETNEEKITDVFLTAQAYLFFLAGFETSSTTKSNALYELALNPHIQDKLRKEIKKVYHENYEEFNYDSVKQMSYLDKVFKEVLRKYPPFVALKRIATNDYIFSNGITVEKGTKLWIPVYAIHRDQNIYPNPEKFDPDRFDNEIIDSRPQMSYLPFGDGPRNCIGERFAHYQTKLCLAMSILHFKFEVCEETVKVYEKLPTSIVLAPRHGLHLKVTKVE